MTTTPGAAIADHHQHGDHEHGENYAHVQGGPAVLDIGGNIGAMIVTLNS